MKVEMRALDTIKPYEKNAKKHDQTQIDNVAESIKQYGFVQPIVAFCTKNGGEALLQTLSGVIDNA